MRRGTKQSFSIFSLRILSVTSWSFWPYSADVLTTFSYPAIIPKTDNRTTVYFSPCSSGLHKLHTINFLLFFKDLLGKSGLYLATQFIAWVMFFLESLEKQIHHGIF